jgi:hypothetical protein
MVGLGGTGRPGGNLRLVIRTDDRVLMDSIFKRGELPRAIDVSLSEVRRLWLVVEFGGNLTAGNYLLLANARLSK